MLKVRVNLVGGGRRSFTVNLIDKEAEENEEEKGKDVEEEDLFLSEDDEKTICKVVSLKSVIMRKKSIPVWAQRLFCNGRELSNNLVLSELFPPVEEDTDDNLLPRVYLLVRSEFKLKLHPVQLLDPITGQLLVEPVLAKDGHTYSKKSLLDWIDTFDNKRLISPITGRSSHLSFVPDEKMISQLEEYLSMDKNSHDIPRLTNIDELVAFHNSFLLSPITLNFREKYFPN